MTPKTKKIKRIINKKRFGKKIVYRMSEQNN